MWSSVGRPLTVMQLSSCVMEKSHITSLNWHSELILWYISFQSFPVHFRSVLEISVSYISPQSLKTKVSPVWVKYCLSPPLKSSLPACACPNIQRITVASEPSSRICKNR